MKSLFARVMGRTVMPNRLYTAMNKIDILSKIGMYDRRVPSPKSQSPRRRTAPRKGDLREAAILDAAERQLAEGGAERITVETIATAAGITRGALYFYFGSKNDVLTALVERTAAAVVADIEGADQSAPSDPREALRQGINRTAMSWAEHGAVMRAAVELSPSVPQIDACWQAAIAAAGNATRPALVRAGVPDDDSPRGAQAISAAMASMTERHFYRASKHGTSLTDAAATLTHLWLAILPE
jgi:AcrR family transcriptional regulator